MILVKTLDSPIFTKEKPSNHILFIQTPYLFENNMNLGTLNLLPFTQFNTFKKLLNNN